MRTWLRRRNSTSPSASSSAAQAPAPVSSSGGNPVVNGLGGQSGMETTTMAPPSSPGPVQCSSVTRHAPFHQYRCHRHPGTATENSILCTAVFCFLRCPRGGNYYGCTTSVRLMERNSQASLRGGLCVFLPNTDFWYIDETTGRRVGSG